MSTRDGDDGDDSSTGTELSDISSSIHRAGSGSAYSSSSSSSSGEQSGVDDLSFKQSHSAENSILNDNDEDVESDEPGDDFVDEGVDGDEDGDDRFIFPRDKLPPGLDDYLDHVETRAYSIRGHVASVVSGWINGARSYVKDKFASDEQDKKNISIKVNKPNRNYPSNFFRTSKYSLLSFLPRFFLEQYRKVSNVYFTIIVLVQFIPGVSPILPITSITPLLFVLGTAGVKEVIEDTFRHLADRKANNKKFRLLKSTHRGVSSSNVASRSLRVGNVIRIMDGDEIPADVVLLSSSNEDGTCFVTTANLDGETNLKQLSAIEETSAMGIDEARLGSFDARISCSAPDPHFEHFKGKISFKSIPSAEGDASSGEESGSDGPRTTKSLGKEQLLLRGSRLQNTDCVYGVVTYAGVDTKLYLNLAAPPSKFGLVDQQLNVWVLLLLAAQQTLCVLLAIISVFWDEFDGADMWFLDDNEFSPGVYLVRNFLTYFILFNIFVPISLWVTLEIARAGQAKFMDWDDKMRSPDKLRHMTAKTSNLNEDLGRIQYVFADKTGTLTANQMAFRQCSAGGEVYGIFTGLETGGTEDDYVDQDVLDAYAKLPPITKFAKKVHLRPIEKIARKVYSKVHKSDGTQQSDSETVDYVPVLPKLEDLGPMGRATGGVRDETHPTYRLMQIMALCHSVVPEARKDSTLLTYRTPSPDEKALVEGAAENGFVFYARTPTSLTVHELGKDLTYTQLAEIPFDSDRKRMTVVVRHPITNRVLVLVKGADNIMYNLLSSDDNSPELLRQTQCDIDKFAATGLRTLAFAYRELSDEEYSEWSVAWELATQSLGDRDAEMARAAQMIERDLILAGATAIEDRLQHKVPQTLEYLRKAGMQVWVLTGDKKETARYIGYSSRLLDRENMKLMEISASSSEACGEQMKDLIRKYCPVDSKYTPYRGFAFFLYRVRNFIPTWMKRRPIFVPVWMDPRYVYSWVMGTHMGGNGGEGGVVTDAVGNLVEVNKKKELALLVDGKTLVHALADHKNKFVWLGRNCKSVVCCRVTPGQKAEVVSTMRRAEGKISLAIGDGANDVSMIQKAHVGVGIFGKEGTQAARASDYAIHQFKHLQRLICVHGRYSYMRSTGLIQYSFYKNICFTLPFLYFSFSSGYTGQALYDSWIIAIFNMLFTAMPPFFYGILEKDLPESALARYPQAYRRLQKGGLLSAMTVAQWLLSAVWHSAVIYAFAVGLMMTEPFLPNGQTAGMWTFGEIVCTTVIIVVNLRMALEIKTWDAVVHISLWGTIVVGVATLTIYALFTGYVWFENMFFIQFRIWGSPTFWLYFVVVVVIALLPDLCWKYFWRQIHPEDWVILGEINKLTEKRRRARRRDIRQARRDLKTMKRRRKWKAWERTHLVEPARDNMEHSAINISSRFERFESRNRVNADWESSSPYNPESSE